MSGALPIWLLVVLSAGALPAQDAERRAIAALRRALSPKSQASPEDRLAAVSTEVVVVLNAKIRLGRRNADDGGIVRVLLGLAGDQGECKKQRQ